MRPSEQCQPADTPYMRRPSLDCPGWLSDFLALKSMSYRRIPGRSLKDPLQRNANSTRPSDQSARKLKPSKPSKPKSGIRVRHQCMARFRKQIAATVEPTITIRPKTFSTGRKRDLLTVVLASSERP